MKKRAGVHSLNHIGVLLNQASLNQVYLPTSHFELLMYIFKMVLFLNKVTLHNDLSDSRGVPTCFSGEANPSDIATMF